MESLGLRPKNKDNPIVAGFVEALGEDEGKAERPDIGGNRPLHRQAWGKAFDYSTSNQIFNGGGTRL